MTRLPEWLQQLRCGLHGHYEVLHFERSRLSLRCDWCGHQTAGWNLRPARTTASGALVNERRMPWPRIHEASQP